MAAAASPTAALADVRWGWKAAPRFGLRLATEKGRVHVEVVLTRRSALAGLACLAGGAALADTAPPSLLFPTGPLSTNPLAKRFKVLPPSFKVPSSVLASDHGQRRLGDLRGKVRIVTLWAEWCAPCIAEMRDFADLNRRAGDASFEIIAILTGSQKKLGLSDAKALLAAHAAVLPLWIEPGGGASLLNSVALGPAGGGTLPCTLLVDQRGRIRGRGFGAAPTANVEIRDGHLTEAAKASMMAGDVRTAWATPAADVFVSALKAGTLG